MAGGATTHSPPRLRTDLILRRQHTPRGVFVVVKDPASDDFYRFGEVEDFILQQLDGVTPLEEIRRRAESRFGASLPDGVLELFVQKLDKNRLLETDRAPKRDRAGSSRRLRGNLLYLRLPLLDPTRLFDWLLPRVGFFFTRGFMAFSAAVIAFAATTLAMSWTSFRDDFTSLGFPSAIPMLIVVLFILVSMHEFAHGMACRHFGGDVREMGFMLIYFAPACYCNVSDAWLFPERAKRMWVGFAGPYFELFLWALAVLVWRVTEGDTPISYVALLVMIGSGVKTLVNFNPLIKLDGYYLLSDFLEIPNLRRKSFRYVGDMIKQLVGSSDNPAQPVSPRERRIYLIYGALATVYSFSLLGLVTMKAGGILIGNGQPIALALFGGLVGTRLRSRIRGLMGKGALDDDSGDAGSDPDPGGVGEPATPRRSRSLRVKRRRVAIVGAASVLVLGAVFGRVELRVSGPVSVLPEENADVRAAVAGIVEDVVVDEGNRVEAGKLIARMSDEALLSDLHTTEADIREAQANLQKLEAGPTPAEIAVARATLAKTVDQAEYARAQLLRIGQAFRLQVVSRREFEDTQALTRAAVDDQVEAQRRLDVLRAGTRREEIEAARARIEGLESRRRHLSEQANRLNVVSPVAGVVATPSRDLHAMERQFVPAGGLIAKVYEIDTVVAQIMVSEKDIANLRPGQRVEVRTRALPGVSFRGVVTSIAVAADAGLATGATTTSSSSARSAAAAKTFVVTSHIDNRTRLLLPGMTGRAKVSCGQRSTLDLIGRRLAQTFKVDVWSWW